MNASRNFVCIRLATYESQAEANFMKKLYVGRSGNVENTTFAILSPDGTKKLIRAGRGPFFEYRNAKQMATSMNKIAQQYDVASKSDFNNAALPFTDSLDIGLNISAADNLPTVVIAAKDISQRNRLATKLRPLAWSPELIGQFTYAEVADPRQLKPLTGIQNSTDQASAILVVQPDQFGLSGKVLAQFGPDTNVDTIKSTLNGIIENFERIPKDHNSHVRLGIRLGIDWQSAIPETDLQSVQAKKRARGQ